MCHTRSLFEPENHRVDNELEKYMWSIHKFIDMGVIITNFDNGKYNYSPYVPALKVPIPWIQEPISDDIINHLKAVKQSVFETAGMPLRDIDACWTAVNI